jgi:hypothetical protein
MTFHLRKSSKQFKFLLKILAITEEEEEFLKNSVIKASKIMVWLPLRTGLLALHFRMVEEHTSLI